MNHGRTTLGQFLTYLILGTAMMAAITVWFPYLQIGLAVVTAAIVFVRARRLSHAQRLQQELAAAEQQRRVSRATAEAEMRYLKHNPFERRQRRQLPNQW